MRVATIRLPSLRSATISSHVHRRAAARLIASRASYNRRRSNSTLAAEVPRASGSNIPLHVKPSHQHSPFASQGSLTPLEQYRRLVDSGALKADEHQTRIIQRLQRLRDDLVTYDPPPIPSSTPSLSLLSRLFSSGSGHSVTVPEEQIPKGLYLYGDVGTGKTMLMDLFYNTLPDEVKRKRRVHFHSFMIDVHKRIHEAKKQLGLDGGDPIAPVARDLASEAYVLCFDEFQVTDIADAMILRQLFEKLLHYGVVCVMTSNRHPDELYKNGIQRSSFVPCIELIKERFEVTDLDSGTDYRRVPRALSHVYYDPISEDNRRELTKIWNAYTSHPSDPVVANRKLETWGRTLLVPESTSTVARFRFMDLCGNPLSAADYLEITKNFGTIFILDIPKMGLGQKDLARRFITFVDACYDSKVKLLALSEVPITKVFADDPNATDGDVSAHMRSIMDDLGLPSDVVGTSSMFTGEEELFAFARCCSRLVQMGSKDWAETAGIR